MNALQNIQLNLGIFAFALCFACLGFVFSRLWDHVGPRPKVAIFAVDRIVALGKERDIRVFASLHRWPFRWMGLKPQWYRVVDGHWYIESSGREVCPAYYLALVEGVRAAEWHGVGKEVPAGLVPEEMRDSSAAAAKVAEAQKAMGRK